MGIRGGIGGVIGGGVEIVDVQGATRGRPELFPDRVHPNNAGAAVIAAEVYSVITGQKIPDFPLASPPQQYV
jgi:hypothetical protein